jgi:zinc transport system substrate-binding protein
MGIGTVWGRGWIVCAVIMLIALTLIGCQGISESKAPVSSDKLVVVTTIFPLYEFAREVGKDKVEVTLLLPPGAEAHTYEPKPSDIIRISSADVFIFTGAGLEPWAQDIIAGAPNKDLALIDASTKVTLLKISGNNTKESYNPHIWLDFNNDMKIVDAIAESYATKDPANRDYYLKNAQDYKTGLSSLDAHYRSALSNCTHREFITAGHDAFAYLAHGYDLQQISAYGVSPDSEPTPQKIKQIVDLTKAQGIGYIYFEELVNPKMAETIAAEAGVKTLVLNPGDNLLKDQFVRGMTFITLMEDNLANLKVGLGCT